MTGICLGLEIAIRNGSEKVRCHRRAEVLFQVIDLGEQPDYGQRILFSMRCLFSSHFLPIQLAKQLDEQVATMHLPVLSAMLAVFAEIHQTVSLSSSKALSSLVATAI